MIFPAAVGSGVDILLVATVAGLASALTLLSGFGLGTLLLAAFSLFFPVQVAVAATGAVHLLNNLFKGGLLRHSVEWRTVLMFGLPAVPAAVAGGWLLALLGETPRLFEWSAFGRRLGPTGADLGVGLLMILFALLELQPRFQRLQASPRLMPLGGILTGFLGGLTGQQGALRSIFLLRVGLPPHRFIGTGVMIAILIDVSRLGTYAGVLGATVLNPYKLEGQLVAVGTVSAFIGAYVGSRHIQKVTIASVRYTVAALMLLIGAALATGVLGTGGEGRGS